MYHHLRGAVGSIFGYSAKGDVVQNMVTLEEMHLRLDICSIILFGNWLPGCNYAGTRTNFKI